MNSDIAKQETNQHYNKFMTVNIRVDKFAKIQSLFALQ